MPKYIVTTADGMGKRTIEASNLVSMCEKLGWRGVVFERHTTRYLQKTPFEDRVLHVEVPSVIAGHFSKYTIRNK